MTTCPNELRALCVSIHDVAPATWPACLRLLKAIRQVADIPVTLLVVPRYHGAATHDAAYESMLDALLAQGHELALHGYTHLDHGPPARGLTQRYLRVVFTTGEGEFAAIPAPRARRLLALGQAWFERRGWPLDGFVAPAWLLGPGAWQALRECSFSYTTTLTRFHLLASRSSVFSPSLVYSARNRSGRCLSPPAMSALAACLARAPLVRLGLHPPDADSPRLMLHAQRLLASLLRERQALTKAAFARRCVAAG
jgi:predicted deacetylase